jgi:hypothetical protein
MKLISSDNMKNVHFLHGFQNGLFPAFVSRWIDRARVQNATDLIDKIHVTYQTRNVPSLSNNGPVL